MNCHSTEAGRLQRLGFASTQPTHDGCAGPKRTAYLLVVSQAGLAVLHCVSIAVSLLPRRCAATSAVARELSEGRGSDPQLSLLSYATRIGQGSGLRSCGFLRPGQALSRLSYALLWMATLGRIELPRPRRQRGVLPLNERVMVRTGEVESPNTTFSRWRLCQFAYVRIVVW